MLQPTDADLPRLPSLVLMVLLVGTLIGWWAWRLWRCWSSAVRLAAAGAALGNRIAAARATAVTTGETVALEVPSDGWGLPNGVRWAALSGYGDSGMRVVTGRIEFHPDGSASAESVRLDVGGRRLVIPLRRGVAV
jgi:hypothetical protein